MAAPLQADFELPVLPQIRQESIHKQVFTHRSYYARPAPGFEDKANDPSPDYEKQANRRCYAVLELAVTTLLTELYPRLHVGPATKLRSMIVENANLATISVKYGLPGHLLADRTQALSLKHTTGVQADIFEAYVGGLYNDQGMDAVQSWLHRLFKPYAELYYNTLRAQYGQLSVPESGSDTSGGHLALFNQLLASRNVEWYHNQGTAAIEAMSADPGPAPAVLDAYRVALGNKATPIWSAHVRIDGELFAQGIANSKKAAKTEAAKQGLCKLGVTV
ncbi:Ribonuclease III [Mycena indigotica]|uniref:Ribonuclease III n=1 Tax=Mycena indigotica TaxID=2126181 RepID=A0A8H6SQL2_9AGAR|nr:Ribonuclease III [Mycena indigotica]KAF7302155.1 Ribonuclease III [Mycena indigotica]